MSVTGETLSHLGFDSSDHQLAYVYEPGHTAEDTPIDHRPVKRRKVTGPKTSLTTPARSKLATKFEKLLRGSESEDCVCLRQELYERCWSETDLRIQSVLDEANEGTLGEVSRFANDPEIVSDGKIPSAFVVTGPNISSQGFLFAQLAARLKSEAKGPVVVLRSGDATNLKSVLKILIRTATNQLSDNEELSTDRDGQKLLYYDLEILRNYLENQEDNRVVVAFQDSEAFETSILVDLINLFHSWLDRIPFVLLFGVATSVELFQERLPKSASRRLYGIQVDVEQTSSVLERIFQVAIASSGAVLRLGPEILSILMERQLDHLQGAQSFISAIKHVHMSHFYGNALSILSDAREEKRFTQILESYHYEAIRTLPSFRKHISDLMSSNDLGRARALLQDDQVLLTEVKQALRTGRQTSLRILRRFHVFQRVSQEPVDSINLYMSFMEGNIQTSDFLTVLIESLKSMTPMQMLVFLSRIETAIEDGDSGIELSGCTDEDDVIMTIIQDMKHKISELSNAAEETEMPVRSSGVIHSKGLRTTVIAQRVQLSYAESTLTALEKEFLEQNERLSTLLEDYFIMADPRHLFLNEIWLVDSTTTLLDAFAPHPREAIETTLSTPYHFLDRRVPRGGTTLSITLPATAILYQRYLEAGSIINMADLWSSFLEIVAGDAEEADEREVLMQFYRALADLKLMGMVKQSKKKADHLAKVSWEGL